MARFPDPIRLRRPIGIDGRSLRFLFLFLLWLMVLGALFEGWPALFGTGYMLPVAWLATALLRLIAIGAVLDAAHLGDGYCELAVGTIVYRVTFDCTGVFAVLALAALTLAYPAPVRQRLAGLAQGLPAVFVFSVARIATLGVIARIEPAWIEVFHVYVMELATLGVVLFVWLYWLGQVGDDRA